MSASTIDHTKVLRLKAVVSDPETNALIRILEVLHDRNVSPQKVAAHRIFLRSQGRKVLHIDIEFADTDTTMHALRFIAARIAQLPITLSTVFGQDSTQAGHTRFSPPSSKLK